jgi:predicted site-specific integrase-resolvase
MSAEPDRLAAKQIAATIGVSLALLQKWRRAKKGPPYVKLVGRIYYPRGDFEKWLTNSRWG